MKNKKILIIVIVIIALLAIIGTAFGYLYLATDTFKSDKELFTKYISQNIDIIKSITNSQTVKVYENLENMEKYESNTDMKITYSEGGEVSNPINNLSAKLDIQKDDGQQYFYTDAQLLFGEEEYLEYELMKEQELYGIRFSDVVKQFVSIRDDENLNAVASDLGIDTNKLMTFMNIMDKSEQASQQFMTKDEVNAIKQNYSNIISEAFSNGTFSSNKKSMITYKNNKVTTNAYTVILNSEQVEKLLVQILNASKSNIENEEYDSKIDETITKLTEEQEIPTVKMTVYEQNNYTIRTVVEIGSYKAILENTEENGQLISNIILSKIDSEVENSLNIKIIKNSTEANEDIDVIFDIINGEEKYTINFANKMQMAEKGIDLNTSISYKKDILNITLIMQNKTNFVENIEKKQTLKDNNIVFNDIDQQRRVAILNQLKENVPVKFKARIQLLKEALGLNNNSNPEEQVPTEMTQVEINNFNAKFEFYTGNEVSAENVKTLLETVKSNLGSYEITPIQNSQESGLTRAEDIRYIMKLNIEKDKVDEEGINKVLEKIKDKAKYKISISYKEENKLIDYITIEEIEK